jgi:hypothetical protein
MDRAAAFFALSPSRRSVAPETTLQRNRAIAPGDPFAHGLADTVYPDNSVREFPTWFEVNRYGGPDRFPHALDFFALSSVEALAFLAAHAGVPSGRRLAQAARLLAAQAWGAAAGEQGFVELLGYAADMLPEGAAAGVVASADLAFSQQGGAYVLLLRDELTSLAAEPELRGHGAHLADAARRFAGELEGADAAQRREVLGSLSHMTANRLGLRNLEEVYLGRILSLAVQQLAAGDPGWWARLWEAHQDRSATPAARIGDMVRPGMERLCF